MDEKYIPGSAPVQRVAFIEDSCSIPAVTAPQAQSGWQYVSASQWIPPKKKKIWPYLLIVAGIYLALATGIVAGVFAFSINSNGTKIELPTPSQSDDDGDEYKEFFEGSIDDDENPWENRFFSGDTSDLPIDEHLTLDPIPARTKQVLSVSDVAEKAVEYSVMLLGMKDGKQNGYLGSGVVFSADGYILTNYHVISVMPEISVYFNDGTVLDAVVVGGDPTLDIAVVKVDASGLAYATFGDSDDVLTGDEVIAVGSPNSPELMNTVTTGIVSCPLRQLHIDSTTMKLIQTSATINPGNSGGPLVNMFGQVIEINTIKVGIEANFEGLGFAIPSSVIKPVVDQLVSRGYVSGRPTIGITAYAADEDFAKENDIPVGVVINYVNPDSGAAAAGLKEGDVLVEANDISIASVEDINAIKSKLSVGDSIIFKYYRNGEYYTAKVVLVDEIDLR